MRRLFIIPKMRVAFFKKQRAFGNYNVAVEENATRILENATCIWEKYSIKSLSLLFYLVK